MKHDAVIEATRRWVASVVIGLNLCPFARRVFDANRIRFVVTDVEDEVALLAVLTTELDFLRNEPRERTETTLLIHPRVLADFLDYNDFTATADQLLDDLGLRGTIQLASFHPAYQFAGTATDAAENYTNRSPFPMLHLLREASISEVADNPDFLAGIPERNIAVLRQLGRDEMAKRLKATTE